MDPGDDRLPPPVPTAGAGSPGAPAVVRLDARSGYDLWAPTYETTPNPVVAQDARVTLGHLQARPGERILDAGCGTGRHLPALAGLGVRLAGVDLSGGMLRQARRRLSATAPFLCLADLGAIPLRSGAFDAVLSALIGEHLSDLPAVFAEFRRLLRPHGRLVFSVYHPEMARAGKEANFTIHGVTYRLGAFRHTEEDYLRAMRGAGFSGPERWMYRGDAALAEEVPDAQRLIGFPVLLVLRAALA